VYLVLACRQGGRFSRSRAQALHVGLMRRVGRAWGQGGLDDGGGGDGGGDIQGRMGTRKGETPFDLRTRLPRPQKAVQADSVPVADKLLTEKKLQMAWRARGCIG